MKKAGCLFGVAKLAIVLSIVTGIWVVACRLGQSNKELKRLNDAVDTIKSLFPL